MIGEHSEPLRQAGGELCFSSRLAFLLLGSVICRAGIRCVISYLQAPQR